MRKIFALILFAVVPLRAQEEVLFTRQAEAYFQAGEYEKARELFEKLLGEKMYPWQEERLIYNIGTTYLEEGNWENASQVYSEIVLLKTYYYLNRALKTNEAVLLYRRSVGIMEQDNLTLDDYAKVLFLLRESLKNIREALSAECALLAFMGASKCEKAIDLVDLRSAVKKELAIVLNKYGEARIATAPVKEGLPYLFVAVKHVLSNLHFLTTKQLDDNQMENYLKLFTRDAESWLSLWEAELAQVEDLTEAYNFFIEGIQKMKGKDLEESRMAFLSSEASLTELIHRIWGKDPLLKLLQNLLTEYERAVVQVPIQVSALYQITMDQKQVQELTKEQAPLQYFRESNSFLEKSLEFARQAREGNARFYLELAKHRILRLLRTKTQQENLAKEILEDAIEDQLHALELQRINQIVEGEREPNEPYTLNAQSFTLQTAAPFLAAVIEREKKEFEIQCQCKPWDKVIPLFEKGRWAAEKAQALIKGGRGKDLVMKEQESAIKYWKEALEMLVHPEEEQEETPPPQEKQPETPKPPPEPDESSSINDVMKLVQQMEQDDRRPEPSQTTPQQGLRPW